jgi:hypothetical protein
MTKTIAKAPLIIDPHWVTRHLDAEMDFVLKSMLETLEFPINFRQLSEILAEAVTSVIHEREPETAKLFIASDLKPVSSGVFSLHHDQEGSWFQNAQLWSVAVELTFAWLTYIQALKLGAPSPVQERAWARDAYDPFANEGGFCNPMKLKLLDED